MTDKLIGNEKNILFYNDEEGNIFELIAEECYYDDLKEEE